MVSMPKDWVQQFMAHKLVELPPVMSPSSIRKLKDAWLDFNKLKEDVKQKFCFINHEGRMEHGYVRRTYESKCEDKAFFHFLPYLMNLEAMQDAPQELKHLLECALPVYFDALTRVFEPFIKALDLICPGVYQKLQPLNATMNKYCVLRMLRYYATPDYVIALPHSDRGILTLQIAESQEGLRGAYIPRLINAMSDDAKRQFILSKMVDIKKSYTGNMLLFAGEKISQIIPDMYSFYHSVIDINSNEKGYVRWAFVFFFHDLYSILSDEDMKRIDLFYKSVS